MKKKVGLIGFGRIGSTLFEKLKRDDEIELGFIYETVEDKTKDIDDSILLKDPKDIGTKTVDLVVEAADFRAVRSLAPEVLRNSDILILSAAALADRNLKDQLEKICAKHSTKIFIPHGALLGMDGLQDARDVLEEVSIVTRKHPKNIDFSFTKEFSREDMVKETVLYDGPTAGICKIFPRNVNTHAVVAISGIGFDRTRSKLIADPGSLEAKHHVIAKSKDTILEIAVSSAIEGVTGEYTLVSVYGTMKRILIQRQGVNAC